MQIKLNNLKKLALLNFMLIIFSLASAYGQELGVKYNFNTGDKEMDLSLNNINIQAKADINNFITDLSVTYKIDKLKIEAMLKQEKMEPADVMMAVVVADIAKKDLDAVVEEYAANKDKGWGVMARNMGIKPGSKEFHALKNKNKEMSGKGKGVKNKKEHPGKGKK